MPKCSCKWMHSFRSPWCAFSEFADLIPRPFFFVCASLFTLCLFYCRVVFPGSESCNYGPLFRPSELWMQRYCHPIRILLPFLIHASLENGAFSKMFWNMKVLLASRTSFIIPFNVVFFPAWISLSTLACVMLFVVSAPSVSHLFIKLFVWVVEICDTAI